MIRFKLTKSGEKAIKRAEEGEGKKPYSPGSSLHIVSAQLEGGPKSIRELTTEMGHLGKTMTGLSLQALLDKKFVEKIEDKEVEQPEAAWQLRDVGPGYSGIPNREDSFGGGLGLL